MTRGRAPAAQDVAAGDAIDETGLPTVDYTLAIEVREWDSPPERRDDAEQITDQHIPDDELTQVEKRKLDMEVVRQQALHWVMGILSGLLFLAAISAFQPESWPNMSQLLDMVFTGIIGIAGTVLGYYFGRGA